MVANTPLTKASHVNKPVESMWEIQKSEYWELWLVGILRMGEAGSSNGKDSEMEPTRVIYLITTEHYGGHSLCVSFTLLSTIYPRKKG